MSRIVHRTLAVSLALTMFVGGTAQAVTTYNTRLRFRASDTSITRGDDVVFKGRLRSPFAKCVRHSTVTLYRDGHAVDSTKTTSTGRFRFVRHPRLPHTWKVKFAGKTGGTHPDQWVCEASVSERIRVRVTA